MSSAKRGSDIYTDRFRTVDDGKPKAIATAPVTFRGRAPVRIGRAAAAVLALVVLGTGYVYLAGLQNRVADLTDDVARLESDFAAFRSHSTERMRALEELVAKAAASANRGGVPSKAESAADDDPA